MNDTIETLEEKKESMICEIEHLKFRLTELEDTENELSAREEEVTRQQHALGQNMGQEEQGIHIHIGEMFV